MRLLERNSKIWERLSGYYSELSNNLNLLIQDAPDGDAYEWQEVSTLLITLELEDSTTFFDVLYGVIPYFVEALEKRKREGDVRSQVDLITKSGLLLLPYQGKGAANNVKNPDIISVFEESISKLQEYAKEFWKENAAYIRRADTEKRRDFCIAMLAIMGDTRLASVLRRDLDADTFRLTCDNCGESHELINKARRVTFKNIVPAEPVNGCWDGVNYQDTYIWLSNMAEQLDIIFFKKYLPYYFGSYACVECDKANTVVELCKAEWDHYVRLEEEKGMDLDSMISVADSQYVQDILNEVKSGGYRFSAKPHSSIRQFALALYSMWITLGAFAMIIKISELMGGARRSMVFLGVFMAGLLWLIVARVTHLYMRFKEDITSNYYEDMVEIKRFGKKSVTFDYAELAKHISEKKIYLQNGTIRIPYADGRFPIFTWDYGIPENDFFQFLRHKCSLSIPDMSAEEIDMVRKTRFGWGCFHGLTLPLLWISIGYCLAVSIAMYGFADGVQEFGALFFSVQNLWGLGVLASLGLTVLVKLFNYVPLRIHFKDYDTVLRVKL